MRCLVAFCLTFLILSQVASATPLEDAVTSYNLKVSLQQDLWDDFQTLQTVANQDAIDMFDALENYYTSLAADSSTADGFWDDHEALLLDLRGQSENLDDAFDALVSGLHSTAGALKTVIDLDTSSSTETAYVTQASVFELENQPFTFWTDPSWTPQITEWPAFIFPGLAVGDNTHTSYVAPTS